MAEEFTISRGRKWPNHLLLPELGQADPPPLSPLATPPRPYLRGPKYNAYSELRDLSIKMKMEKSKISSTPPPLPLRKSSSSRKENRKPSSAITTPPQLPLKIELRRAGSESTGRMDEKKGRVGSGLLTMRRSFSGFNQVKEAPKASAFKAEEEGRAGRGGSRVVSRKSFAGF